MAAKPERYRVRNWAQFQHYKDRNPTWIKLHFALLASEDWVTLDDASKLLAIVCMLVASRNDGYVPNNPAYLKRVAYLNRMPKLNPLVSCGFLENPLADASKPYQTLPDARPETETEEIREEKKDRGADAPTDMAFVGRVIRLKASDYDRWRRTYHAIPDFVAELTKADDFYSESPPKDGKWFFPVSKWLDRAHKDALAGRVDPDAAIYRGVL